jgi:hypothetical protein
MKEVQMNKTEFRKELETLINRKSMENASNTPDFILAEFLTDSLEAFDKATRSRSEYYGLANLQPGQTKDLSGNILEG